MSPKPINQNTLFYGDNLTILREYIADESIDLVYLDPPFNSKRTYNVLFKHESGEESEAQIAAFDDTWHWDQSTAAQYHELITEGPAHVSQMIDSLCQFIGTNQMMAYLVMMASRLVELHRVLKPTGSLYLHCDPTASHYLKVILDTTFSPENFRSEITWKRTSSHSDARRKYPDVTDTIFFYSKSDKYHFSAQYEPYSDEYIEKNFRYIDRDGRRYSSSDMRSPNPRPNLTYDYKGYKPHPNGWIVSRELMEQLDIERRLIFPKKKTGRIRMKKYLDEMPGVVIGNIWSDIKPVQSQANERLGFPTQKPIDLLTRIIRASSNQGDIVLDPFCGCGTTVAAGQKLDRIWIGIDITHLAIALQKYRLQEMFPEAEFQILGEPETVPAAQQLAEDDRFQFEWWALSLVKARPTGGQKGSKKGKKGADRGIDGVITFIDDSTNKAKRALIQVKSGHVSSATIRDLVGTVDREKATLGVLVTLEKPTKPMITEAASAGFYHSPGWQQDYPKVQVLTIEDLLDGGRIQMPPTGMTFKQAQRVKEQGPEQGRLFND